MSYSDKFYNPETGLWHDEIGSIFIKNEFNPEIPIWLDISREVWSVNYLGNNCSIDWNEIALTNKFLEPFKEILKKKLRKNSVRYIDKVRCMLKALGRILEKNITSIEHLDINGWSNLWGKINSSDRIFLREFFIEMAKQNLGGINKNIAIELKSWKARSDVKLLRNVLSWNEQKGALTNAETEIVRQELLKPLKNNLSDSKHAGRILTWIMFETLKRGVQITQMLNDDLYNIKNDSSGVIEWMLKIPMAKHQTGMGSQWWPISAELAGAIKEYQNRASIKSLQMKYKNLILWKTIDLDRGGISAQSVRTAINSYVSNLDIISPRTKNKIKLTPTRIRHTGATLLAKNGVSRDVIQEILEHDSPQSANAYIDACGSELIPAIDRVDRTTNTFNELAEAFFKGTTKSTVGKNPIYIPVTGKVETPALVGDCGKDGYCPRHPFHACYDGCVDFIAWREGDHMKALKYTDKAQSYWKRAEIKERTNAPKNFERLRKAILEVIEKIEIEKES